MSRKTRLIHWYAKEIKNIQPTLYSAKTMATAQTADGFEVKTTVGVNFSFDPWQAAADKQQQAVHLALQPHPETIINRQIRAIVQVGLNEYIGRLDADQLMQNGAVVSLQEWLLGYVHDLLHVEGVVVRDPDGIVIARLEFPEEVRQAHSEAYRIQKIASAWSFYAPEAQQLVLALAQRNGMSAYQYNPLPNGTTGDGVAPSSPAGSLGRRGRNIRTSGDTHIQSLN